MTCAKQNREILSGGETLRELQSLPSKVPQNILEDHSRLYLLIRLAQGRGDLIDL